MHTYIETQIIICVRYVIDVHSQTHAHKRILTNAHSQTHTHKRTLTNAYSQTHTHKRIGAQLVVDVGLVYTQQQLKRFALRSNHALLQKAHIKICIHAYMYVGGHGYTSAEGKASGVKEKG